MTKDEIIKLAREAGPLTQGPFDAWCKRFAALVAAHEREACAKVCEGRIGGAVKDDQWWRGFRSAMAQCAEAIRARGTI